LRLRGGGEDLAVAFTASRDGGYRDDSGVDQQKLSLAHRHRGGGVDITSGLTAVNLNQETAGFVEGPGVYRDRSLSRTNPNPEAYRDARAACLLSRVPDSGDRPGCVFTLFVCWCEMAFF